MFPTLVPALPEIFLAVSALALLIIGVFIGPRALRPVAALTVLALVVAIGITLSLGEARVVTLNHLFVMDGFGRFMKLLILIGSALSVIVSLRYIEREEMDRFEFPLLMLLSTIGMMMMVSANDLIALYIGLELQSLALYVVAAFRRDAAKSSEAGLKYFLLGALSSGLLLYGSSLVYGFAGTTSFDGISQMLTAGGAPVGLIVGIVFISAALAFKVSAVPFHMWTPDVYEGAPTPVTAFFAVAPKIAALALFVRVMIGPFGHVLVQWQQIVYAISVASMVLGAFAAINQTNIKRLMAYSSIGHVGYALIGLTAGSQEGVSAILIYLAIYLAMNVGTFAVILCMRREGRMVEQISDLSGLASTSPRLALAMMIFMFSMAGIPPLAGFFGKLYIFLSAIHAHLYVLAIIGVLSSVVGAFYYLRVVKVMYFDPSAGAFEPAGPGLGAVLVGTGLFTAAFLLFAGPVVASAAQAAATLFAG